MLDKSKAYIQTTRSTAIIDGDTLIIDKVEIAELLWGCSPQEAGKGGTP